MKLNETSRFRALASDRRGEIAAAYLFVIAMSLLVFASVMGMSLPIRDEDNLTLFVLGENTP